MHINRQLFTLEITVISAEGLKPSCSILFSNRLRPFITLTTLSAPAPSNHVNGYEEPHAYHTRVDGQGGINPKWGDKFVISLNSNFFANTYSCIYLRVYTKRLIAGQTQLGWCQIPAHDIGLPPVGSVRYLSYRLRSRDGSKTRGVLNLSVKLEDLANTSCSQGMISNSIPSGIYTCQTVIGVSVTGFPIIATKAATCEA